MGSGKTQGYESRTDENGAQIDLYPAPSFEARPPEAGDRAAVWVAPYKPGQPLKMKNPPDLGVHLHLHFEALLDEMAFWLSHIPFAFSLYVSISDASNLERVRKKLAGKLPNARITIRNVANRGRDLGPMVTEFAPALAGHEYIAHVHGKRSVHSSWKSDWRRQLLARLMGSEDTVRFIFQQFEADPGLGMVFPVYHHSLQKQISWGKNYEQCQQLASRLDLVIAAERMAIFPAGSMFWARSSVLTSLLEAGLTPDDFPPESGQLDGTPAHALERLFGELVEAGGGRLMQIRSERNYQDRCFNPPRGWSWNPARWFRRA